MSINIKKPIRTLDGREVSQLAWIEGLIFGSLDGTPTVWHESGAVLAVWPLSSEVPLCRGDDIENVMRV